MDHSLPRDQIGELHARGFFDPLKVEDDGSVSGMEEALDRLLDRYPWLGDPPEDEPDPAPTVKPGGRRIPPPRKAVATRLGRERRFPSLKGRSR